MGFNTYEVYLNAQNNSIRYTGGISRHFPNLHIHLDYDRESFVGVTHTNAESTDPYDSLKDLITEYMGTRSNTFTQQQGSGFDTGMTWKADPHTLIISLDCFLLVHSTHKADFEWLLNDPECPIDMIVVDLDTIHVKDGQVNQLRAIYYARKSRFL